MKNLLKNPFVILILAILVCNNASGQERIRQVSCFDSTLKRQADSLKLELAKEGFIVVREAAMSMESEYEMPVIVPLNEGNWYQFAFIGDADSKLYEVRMYDFNEKQVIYKKHYGDGMESNIISYSFVPRSTEYHVVKPVQVANRKKSKSLCGYIIMLKKVK